MKFQFILLHLVEKRNGTCFSWPNFAGKAYFKITQGPSLESWVVRITLLVWKVYQVPDFIFWLFLVNYFHFFLFQFWGKTFWFLSSDGAMHPSKEHKNPFNPKCSTANFFFVAWGEVLMAVQPRLQGLSSSSPSGRAGIWDPGNEGGCLCSCPRFQRVRFSGKMLFKVLPVGDIKCNLESVIIGDKMLFLIWKEKRLVMILEFLRWFHYNLQNKYIAIELLFAGLFFHVQSCCVTEQLTAAKEASRRYKNLFWRQRLI